MKRLTKLLLIIAALLLVVGAGFTVAGKILGADISEVDFLNDMGRRVFRAGSTVNFWQKDSEEEESYQGKLSKEQSVEGNTYRVEDVETIVINLQEGELVLQAYEGNQIEIEVDRDLKDEVQVSTGEKYLMIESQKKRHDDGIIVRYPKQMELTKLDIEVGAGEIEVKDEIHAREISITIGAGEFQADACLWADEVSIEVGAGKAEIDLLSVENLTGSCGVGEMDLLLAGKESEYAIYLECGLGSIEIGQNRHSSIAGREEINPANADKRIELSCGMGQIEVDFGK